MSRHRHTPRIDFNATNKILIILIVIVLLVGLMILFSTIARADGCDSVKDCSYGYSYRDEPSARRPARYDDERSHRLRPYIIREDMRELERIRRRAERRREASRDERTVRRNRTVARRYAGESAYALRDDRRYRRSRDYEASRPVRYAQTRRRYLDDAYSVPSKRCMPAIKATSKPMLTEERAKREVRRTWSMMVGEQYSGDYNDVSIAQVVSMKCKPPHYGAWRTACSFVARPCRD